ncbi:hypothetical protein ACI79Y_04070 [Modestobacter sp. SYSU DS0875]
MVFLLAVFDGLLPPVPSESVVIGLAAFSAAGVGPNLVLSALGGASWATYSVGVGALGGRWVEDQPLLGAVAGIAFAATLGLVIDRLVRRRTQPGAGRVAEQDQAAATSQPRT